MSPKYHLAVKNTFLDIRPVEDFPPVPRQISWSSGDDWPVGLTFDGSPLPPTRNIRQADSSKSREKVPGKSLVEHRKGTCYPCVYFASSVGCRVPSCGFCHLAHSLSKRRPQKQERDMYKAAVEGVFKNVQDPTAQRMALQNLAMQNHYLHSYIIGQIDRRA